MIITQTRERRSFIGSMNSGLDVIDSLKSICVDNNILCANVSGIGYLKDAKLRTYNPSRRGFEPTVSHAGVFHVVALHGNVSLQDKQTVISCHVVGTVNESEGSPTLISGELVAGEIVSFEFSLNTCDDIRLFRAEDPKTGLEPWLHMDLGRGPIADDDNALIETDRPTPGDAAAISQENFELTPGDFLDHPTLGTCEVTDTDDDDRLSIRLESGRTVEIHRALLQLEPAGTTPAGDRLIKVRIKRRR